MNAGISPFRLPKRRACRTRTIPSVHHRLTVLALALVLVPASAARAQVEGRILQTGFMGTDGPCYRRGDWCPIRVELTLRGTEPFSGTLRVTQPDMDADLCVCEVPVALAGDGNTRTYWLYSLPNPTAVSSNPFEIQLIHEEGEAQAFVDRDGSRSLRLAERQFTIMVPQETILVLDISAQPLSRLDNALFGAAAKMRDDVRVVRAGLDGVPSAWFGYEMIDFVVWDAADPADLDFSQLDALIQWVRQGGRLILAAGRTANSLAQSKLGPLLPVEIGPTELRTQMPEVQREMLGMNNDEGWPDGITVCRTTLRPGFTDKIYRAGETDPGFLSTATVGHGSITFVAADLKDLMSGEPEAMTFLRYLFGFRQATRITDAGGFRMPSDLFGDVKQTVDFRTRSGAFMGVAILFVIGYVLTATVVAWQWLKKRSWQQHNWTVFALVVLGAGGLSLGAVQFIRGARTELHQLSVVDVQPDGYAAEATCYFGLKTATHTTLDLWLPSNVDLPVNEQPGTCSLKPLPPAVQTNQSGFLSPLSYRARPVRAILENAPFRATLKQFAGHWSGELKGNFRGHFEIGAEGIHDRSWVENQLGVDLQGCYILSASLDTHQNRSGQAIDVYDLGDIADGERIEGLGTMLRRRRATLDRKSLEDEQFKTSISLADCQKQWLQDLNPGLIAFGQGAQREIDPENYDKALLLLSTMSEYDPLSTQGNLQGWDLTATHEGWDLTATHGRTLDRSDSLTRRTALLVGFANEPGPARVCIRGGNKTRDEFRVLVPSEGRTMYRVLFPAER